MHQIEDQREGGVFMLFQFVGDYFGNIFAKSSCTVTNA